MSDIDMNTFGLDHNPDGEEHGRRMGRTLVRRDADETVADETKTVRSNPLIVQATERNETLDNLDTIGSLN